MRNLLLTFILLLQSTFIFGINSQVYDTPDTAVDSTSYFGKSACWSYKAIVYEQIIQGYRTTSVRNSVSGDTLIQRHKYLMIYSETNVPILIRQENKKIVVWSKDNKTDFLLYDFGLKKGDTIRTTAQSGYLRQLSKVSNVDTIQLYNGNYAKRFTINNYDQWIEGIGSVNGFYYPLRDFVTCDCNSSYELISFAKEEVLSFYNPELCTNFNCCKGAKDDVKSLQVQKAMFDIYPNPAKEIITIKSFSKIEESNFEVFDSQGKMVINTPIDETNNSVSLNQFPNGIYFYRISTDGKFVQSGKLSKE